MISKTPMRAKHAGGGERPLVLHVRVVTGSGGGPEKTILNSPRFLDPLGYDCVCAYLHPPGDPGFEILRERARELDAPLFALPDRGASDLGVLKKLIRFARERRVAIWHGHEYKSNVFGLIARRFWPMKLATTVHGWVNHSGRAPLYDAIDRRILRFYDHVVGVSRDLCDECLEYGVRPERCTFIHNAIDSERFRRTLSTAEAKQAIGAPAQGVLVGAVGRLAEEKRFDLLIQAVARLVQNGRDVHLWIAGDGAAHDTLQGEVHARNLGHRVRLLGVVPDPRLLLQASDLFALSSMREGLPNVLLEAMAMETPVVATRIAGIPELLSDGAVGVLVEPGSEAAIASGMESLLDDDDRRVQIVRDARARIEERYSFQHRMSRMAELYGRLLGNRAPACAGAAIA